MYRSTTIDSRGDPTLPQEDRILGSDICEIPLPTSMHKNLPRTRAHIAHELCRGVCAYFSAQVRQNIGTLASRTTKATGTVGIAKQAPTLTAIAADASLGIDDYKCHFMSDLLDVNISNKSSSPLACGLVALGISDRLEALSSCAIAPAHWRSSKCGNFGYPHFRVVTKPDYRHAVRGLGCSGSSCG